MAKQAAGQVHLCDGDGASVAALSKASAREWSERLSRIKRIQVLGMIQRRREDEKEEYKDRCHVERWEVPWVEIVHVG